LNEEHNARRTELNELRETFAAESARLRKEAENLTARIGKLDESVRALESGLDERLSLLCSRTIKEARNEIEAVAGTIVSDATVRAAQTLNNEVDQASDRITVVQAQAVAAVSGSLERQTHGALQAFEQSMETLAKETVERWKSKLGAALSALGKSFGEQIKSE
jgi:chromosome segregation ATPase